MTDNRILIVDDDPEIWHAYQIVLGSRGGDSSPTLGHLAAFLDSAPAPVPPGGAFALEWAAQGQVGLEKLRSACREGRPFSVAFVDIRMPPGWDGVETATRLRAEDPDLEIVIVTAYSDRSREEIAQRVQPPDKLLFFRKPFDPEELFQLALSLTSKWRMVREERAARDRFQSLVETMADGVWETDAQGRFTYCSPVCAELYGWRPEELMGTAYADLLAESEQPLFAGLLAQCVQDGTGFRQAEHQIRHRSGAILCLESSAVPMLNGQGRVKGFRGVDRDVSERKRLAAERAQFEEQYRQSQKMEAMGTLAGGIAHDLNNLLSPIMGFAELALLKVDNKKSVRSHLEMVIASTRRAAELVRQILVFSRKEVMVTKPLDPGAVVAGFLKMLRRLLREDIELLVEQAPGLWPVVGDAGQLEQVLLNLVVNARDALPGGGTITIRIENVTLAGPSALVDVSGTAFHGEHVLLSVADNGVGIPAETLGRIFEPFFTTKGQGQGTGLGLATVFGIIRQHGGHIRVETAVGQGTTFRIYLPRGTELAVEAGPAATALALGGHETVLLVEDDQEVRNIAVTALQHYGFRVLVAENGAQALERFRESRSEVDVVVADVVMPVMGGEALAEALRQEAPGLPILFMSGYPLEVLPRDIRDKPASAFLQKPFGPQDLVPMLRGLLDHGQ
ncbi:MAG: response regulator [Thermodesulfobacteriota bacterium]